MNFPRQRLHLLALLAALGAPRAAYAAESPNEIITDAARYKAERGLELFQAKQWKEAYEAFRIAEELFHAPSLVMRMAYCQAELGHLLEARALYRKVADEKLAKDAPEAFRNAQAEAKQELGKLAKRIAKVRVAVDGVESVRANVKLDGVHIPLEPESVEVDPGAHRIEAKAPGAEAVERRLTVAEGADQRVELRLVPLREKVVVVTKSSLGLAPGLLALGVGVAGIATGAVTGILVMRKVDDFEARCGGLVCPTSLESERDQANLMANVSTASFVVGGVGLAASALLLPLHFAKPSEEVRGDTAKVSLGLSPFGGKAVVRW
ncbi:MAG: hypothetical protein FJ096_14830 [Deltaproteobacteria bacterium]|nr:hypothetical protein [Deltaproteobacteria bacterium]